MKNVLAAIILSSLTLACYADWNTYETKQEAYNRRSNENYNTYKNNNYQQPLGGYNRQINDNGGRQYGYNSTNTGFGSLNNNTNNNWNNNNSWNNF